MVPTNWRAWMFGAMLLGLAGCKGSQGQPDDPLFLSRAPLEAKAQAGPPVHLTYSQPAMPPRPSADYAGPGVPVDVPSPQK